MEEQFEVDSGSSTIQAEGAHSTQVRKTVCGGQKELFHPVYGQYYYTLI